MEGELGALGEGAEQDQDEGGRVAGIVPDLVGDAYDRGDLVASGSFADQEKTREHREATDPRHGERHPRALTRVSAVLPVADQQERSEAGDFPEHREEQQVVGEYDPQHRRHEEREPGVELTGRVGGAEVVTRIEDDEESDPENQYREEQGESVEPEREGQA